VFTSNVFAIMGLRSLFFAVAGAMGMFHFLKYGLSAILAFIGVKMFIMKGFDLTPIGINLQLAGVHIPIGIALGVIASVLAVSIILSLVFPEQQPADDESA
jgi:tellurite resistance protein TerC